MARLPRGGTPSPRHRLAAAIPHVHTGATPEQFLWKPIKIDFWLNDRFGDCVTAEEAFAKACHDPEIFIPAHKIHKWAQNHFVLNGAGLYEVLDLMVREGIPHDDKVYMDGPFTSVDWTDAALLRNAISVGPVKLGVAADQLENKVWQGNTPYNGWLSMGITPGDPQDHCISLCGYGTMAWLMNQLNATMPTAVGASSEMWAVFTWDSIGIIDWQSLQNICGEAWLRNPTTVVK